MCFLFNEKGVLMCAVIFRIHLDQIDEMGSLYCLATAGKTWLGKNISQTSFEQIKKYKHVSMIQQSHDT